MNKRGLIKLIVLFVVVVVVGFFWFVRNYDFGEDLKCVPASCCHATDCVLEIEAPNCSGVVCSMNCEPGTLDCEQARCEFVDGKCEAVIG